MSTTVHPARDAPAARGGRVPALGLGLVVLGLGLALNSLLGPLAADLLELNVSETHLNQMIGLDAASLAIVAPLSVLAGALVLRGHVAGPLLALGIGAYTAYMFVQYVLGPEYLDRPGESARLFPLYLGLFVLGWSVALAAWRSLDGRAIPGTARRDRLVGGVLLPLLALVAFSRYLPALADVMGEQPSMGDYLAGPTFFWSIALMDLGIFLPATAAACIGLARGAHWGRKAAYGVIGWFGLVGPAVAAMAVAMYVNDDPNASGANVATMTALGMAFVALAIFVFAPPFGRAAHRLTEIERIGRSDRA